MFDSIPLVLAQADTKDNAAAPVSGADLPPSTTGTPGTPGTSPGTTPGAQGTPTTGAPGSPAVPPRPQGGFGDSTFLFILMGGLILMIIFSMRNQRKDRKKRENLLGALKKGDRIQTIGGLLGTVIEVRADRVIIKADENNNTKLTFVRAAIQAVVADGAGEKPEPEVKPEN